jgi:LmbE family N-acetylglucosaminyl deacetylase
MDEQKGGLLVVMAHPDDESMGTGGMILRHTRAGIATHLVCATYGEKGWMGKPPGAKAEDLPEIRVKELEEAAVALGLAGVELWDYPMAASKTPTSRRSRSASGKR